jgi:hypothetical protein
VPQEDLVQQAKPIGKARHFHHDELPEEGLLEAGEEVPQEDLAQQAKPYSVLELKISKQTKI